MFYLFIFKNKCPTENILNPAIFSGWKAVNGVEPSGPFFRWKSFVGGRYVDISGKQRTLACLVSVMDRV